MKRMRRISILLLTAVLLACVPTPDTEYIVNKTDGILESRIRETAAPEGEAVPTGGQPFPDRWETTFDTSGGGIVTVNAAILQKADGVYPVIRTKKGEITKDDAVRLAFCEEVPSVQTLARMDLFNVSSIKRVKGGGVEGQFFDRQKALERLYEYAREGQNGQTAERLLDALTEERDAP